MTFQQVVFTARDSKADIDFDPATDNPHFATTRMTEAPMTSGSSTP